MNSTVIRRALAIFVTLVALSGVASAHAQEPSEPINLSIKPVDIQGNFFDLTMEPGETRQLTVELGNHGTGTVSAHTYAANAYSIHGGGFGARLDGEPVSGVTLWLEYPAETFNLDAGKSNLRTFSVEVPEDVEPGEYITSLVIQNAIPTAGDGDGVSINQINRQAIAVNITVPGPRTPELTIGAISHHVAGMVSIVSVGVHNPGNVHLKPAGEFVLLDSEGVEISRYPVVMDSFYAGTETQVEIPFDTHLNEGDYTATLSLRDDKYDVEAVSEELALHVPAAVETIIVPSGEGSAVATANQQREDASGSSPFPLWIVFVVFGSMAAGVAAALITVRLSARRRTDHASVGSGGQLAQSDIAASSSPSSPQPVSVKQLVPRPNTDKGRYDS